MIKLMSETKKVVIITGGADGIGAACVDVFFKSNYNVAVIDVNRENLSILNKKYNQQLNTFCCDISSDKDLTLAFNLIIEKYGRLDCLVNNAGVHPPVRSIENLSVSDFRKNLDINLVSNYLLCQLGATYLKKSKGTVVFVSSLVALIDQDNAAAYCASKSGQLGLVKSLAIELAPEVRVNGVAPSNVMTTAMKNWLNTFEDPSPVEKKIADVQKLKRMAQPSEIAEIIYFLANEKSSFITGQTIVADGGASLDYY